MKKYWNAIVLAIIGGFVGLHKFYLGRKGVGILYAVFFWTGIPAIISIIDAAVLLFKSEEDFNAMYNEGKEVDEDKSFKRLESAKNLLDIGAITQEEYLDIKAKIMGE